MLGFPRPAFAPAPSCPGVAAVAVALAVLALAGPARAQDPVTAGPEQPVIRITSPLGRTGTPATVRIVAQIQWPDRVPQNARRARVTFLVDDAVVGVVEDGPPYAVTWEDGNPFEPHEIAAVAEVAGGTLRDQITLPAFELVNRTEVKSVLVEAAVYDRNGRPVSNLGPGDFGLSENDQLQELDIVQRETFPTTALLLVDNSQSMARRIEDVRRAAERFARSLGKGDRVIVVPFNHEIGTVTGPTDDLRTITEAITAMKAGGGTAILNALERAARLLEGVEGRRAIILITDGFDENSTIDMATAVQALQAAQATVYTVSVGGTVGFSLFRDNTYRQVAERTGGRSFFPWRDADLTAVARDIVEDAHSRYLLTYTPSNQRKDGRWRTITVHVPDGYRVRAREGYQAPEPPPIRPTIEFTVTDAERGHVAISVDDLEVYEDGVLQAIDTFQEAVDPVSIVLALDASGSMRRAEQLVIDTAREFVAQVRPEDSLAVIMFADEPTFGQVLSTNRENTLNAIAKYRTGGGTALYDALWNAMMHLRPVKGRRAIVVLSDGRDENNPGTAPGSVHTLDEVLELGRRVGAVVFPIGLGPRVDEPVLRRLARESGGAVFLSPDPEELPTQFRGIVENLRQRYVLSYTSTNAEADGAWRTVEIRAKNPSLTVASSGGYFAPTE